jgi:hypothetical protein
MCILNFRKYKRPKNSGQSLGTGLLGKSHAKMTRRSFPNNIRKPGIIPIASIEQKRAGTKQAFLTTLYHSCLSDEVALSISPKWKPFQEVVCMQHF